MLTTRGIFITGTDTGIGKTVVTAVLARLLAESGRRVAVMKPVTSGCDERNSTLFSADAELAAWGAGVDPANPDIAPVLLRAPLAPSEAAKLEGVRIDFEKIAAAYDRLARDADIVLVEGAGGLMVPLAGGLLMADLAKRLDLPLLVVARPGLGTVNHTLLTTYAAGQLGLRVTGIVINGFPDSPDQAEGTAPHLIGTLAGAPLLGLFPRMSGDEREIVTGICEQLRRDPLTGILLREVAGE